MLRRELYEIKMEYSQKKRNIKDLFSFETRTLPLIENKSPFEEIKEKGIIKKSNLYFLIYICLLEKKTNFFK